jgi:hypothetical protein
VKKISHDFACKWNLKFNHSKSKVLVVGQRIDKNRKWYRGNEKIDETDNYKYFLCSLFQAYLKGPSSKLRIE